MRSIKLSKLLDRIKGTENSYGYLLCEVLDKIELQDKHSLNKKNAYSYIFVSNKHF